MMGHITSGALDEDHGKPIALVISSVHDFRLKRRGSIQAIADGFRGLGYRTVFLSIRFSLLSLAKRDPRGFLWSRANRFEAHNGIECYLWRTPIHPFTSRSKLANKVMEPFHELYARWPDAALDRLFSNASVVVVESGLGIVLAPRIRRINERALIVYRGADALDTIGAHPYLSTLLEQSHGAIDHYCLLAKGMAPQFIWARARTYYVPQGIEPGDFENLDLNPYAARRNAVSVGSMLFDPSFFALAAPAFPNLDFHVIGSGAQSLGGANVRVLGEMAFRETLPYIAHATIGLAPYRETANGRYLAESSLKLTQYDYLRRPAVCPHFAVGTHPHRFGYTPGHAGEIRSAIEAALADRFETGRAAPLSWSDVVRRLVRPGDFPDTAIDAINFRASA